MDLAIIPPIAPQSDSQPDSHPGKFWLVGETPASRSLAQAMDTAGLPWLATVAAPGSARLYAGLKGEVQTGAIDSETLSAWLVQEQIAGILDASPPLAAEISRQAIATGLPYLRFERPALPLGDHVTVVSTWEEVCRAEILAGQRVLLTVGSRALPWFVPWLERAHLWARILPGGVERAIAAGFPGDRLLEQKLPRTLAQEQALWQRLAVAGFPGDRLLEQKLPRTLAQEQALWQRLAIDRVITTPSSTTGGLSVKQAVAEILGVRLLVVARPDLRYPQTTSDLAVAIAFVQEVFRRWGQDWPSG